MIERADPATFKETQAEAFVGQLGAPSLEAQGADRRQRRLVSVGRVLVAVIALVGWEALSTYILNPFFLSKPSAIAVRLTEWVTDGSLAFHFGITVLEMTLGLLLGSGLGIMMGALFGLNRLTSDVMGPFVTAVYTIPRVALVPVFILWFGIDLFMKVALNAAVVFFVMFFNTYAGVRDVDQELVNVIRLTGAGRMDVLLKVVAPSAAPWVFTGLTMALPYSLTGAVVAEMFASNRGLGYLLAFASGTVDTTGVFAVLVILMALGGCIQQLVVAMERRTLRWKQ
jgi:NitT/TauT family transport system permease protein